LRTNHHKLGYNFNWLDVCEPNDVDFKQVADEFKLPQLVVIDCLQPEHLPKFEYINQNFFIIFRYFDPNCTLQNDTFQQISRKIALFYNKQQIITIHRNAELWLNNTAAKYAGNNNIQHTDDMVCKILKNALETYENHLSDLNKNIDFFESRIFLKNKTPDLVKNLYFIKRRLYMIKRLLTLSKSVIESMGTHGNNSPHYYDLKDFYTKIDTITEEAYDSILSLLHIYISLSSQRTNEVMRLLTVFSAFFLPLTFIVGIYGMNFKFMPELEFTYGYPAIIGLMATVTVVIFIWFKRKGLV